MVLFLTIILTGALPSVIEFKPFKEICLDPKCLNSRLKRCPHNILTIDELTPEFADARIFSKIDT